MNPLPRQNKDSAPPYGNPRRFGYPDSFLPESLRRQRDPEDQLAVLRRIEDKLQDGDGDGIVDALFAIARAVNALTDAIEGSRGPNTQRAAYLADRAGQDYLVPLRARERLP